MKRYSLLFDASFWLFKTFHVCQRMKMGKGMDFINDPEADKQLLLWKLSVDFAAEIRRFRDVTNQIVYCMDYSSWRKQMTTDQDYKGNRVQSTNVDWTAVFAIHEEFITAIKKMGVITSKVKNAEADDLIFGWSSYLNQMGQNAIIISGDNDFLQLINYDKNLDVNTVYYNKFDKNLHVFPGFSNWLKIEDSGDIADIFNLGAQSLDTVKSDLTSLIQKEKIKINEIHTNDFLFKKILKGDDGDNVSPLYVKIKETKRGPQRYVITDKQADDILAKFRGLNFSVKQHHFFTDEFIKLICELTKTHLNIQDKSNAELVAKWKMNRDLMFLHKNCLPTDIFDAIMDDIEHKINLKISAVHLDPMIRKEEILKLTTYQSDLNPNDTSILKNVKPITPVNITDTQSSFDDSYWSELLK